MTRNLLLATAMAAIVIAPLAATVAAADMFAVPSRGPRIEFGEPRHDWRRHDLERERYWRWRHRHHHWHGWDEKGD